MNQYFKQVELLLRVLPYAMKQSCFALKGGTAINLFYKNMPRYSVDIDLTYLPVNDRSAALNEIEDAMKSIEKDIKSKFRGISTQMDKVFRLILTESTTQIKIEPNLVLRGHVYPVKKIELCQNAQKEFEVEMSISCLSEADLYGGKICAALDRQHPRDLFDVKLLLAGKGITEEIKNAFLIYLISATRPINEMLNPNFIDQKQVYETEFMSMARESVSYEELEQARLDLIASIRSCLSENDKEFLISVKEGHPKWDLFPVDGVQNLPGVKWKLFNIGKMTSKKREADLKKLKKVLTS